MRLGLVLFLLATAAQAQWQIQQSNTTADLRGVHALGNGVAWASGSKGTVLRTTDNGSTWQACAVPPGAEALDFRGVQAFSAASAVVMSSGKGELSRLYRTDDACKNWKLLFTNPDEEGFWDALSFRGSYAAILGDPVAGAFCLFVSTDGGLHWTHQKNKGLAAQADQQGAFAASNSSLIVDNSSMMFGSGGTYGPSIYKREGAVICLDDCPVSEANLDGSKDRWSKTTLSSEAHAASAGLFSIFARNAKGSPVPETVIAVGGDYLKANAVVANAFRYSNPTWSSAVTPPHGYRSAVAYLADDQMWITVGPNGTDISSDDGRNWRALRPAASGATEEDQHWNALSLPFVVGPHGRIGLLRPDAIAHAASSR